MGRGRRPKPIAKPARNDGFRFRSTHPTSVAPTARSFSPPWFATFRGRIGALIDPSTLIYLTGGLAVGRFEFNTSPTVTVGSSSTAPAVFDESTTRVGGAVGAGVEKKFTPKWSAKAEFLYLDFGSPTFLSGKSVETTVRLHAYIARVGLNHAFN